MKTRIQGLVCALFYTVLFFGTHAAMAIVPMEGDAAWRTVIANLSAVIIGSAIAAALGERPFRSRRCLRPPTVLYSILFGGGFAGVVLLMMTYIPLPADWIEHYTTQSATPSERTAVAWLSALIVAPLAEEIVFRGLLYPSLKRATTAVPAALLVSVLFGAVHGTLLWGMYTCLLSLLAIWLMHRTGSLWTAILFHAAFNLCGQLPAFFPSAWGWLDAAYLWICAAVFFLSGVLLMRLTRHHS